MRRATSPGYAFADVVSMQRYFLRFRLIFRHDIFFIFSVSSLLFHFFILFSLSLRAFLRVCSFLRHDAAARMPFYISMMPRLLRFAFFSSSFLMRCDVFLRYLCLSVLIFRGCLL